MRRQSKPIISLCGKGKRIYIGKDVLRILDNPVAVCIKMNTDYSSIAIFPCEVKHVMGFKVPDKIYKGGRGNCVINSIQFVSDVLRINQLDRNSTYRIPGQAAENKQAVIFHVSEAVCVGNQKMEEQEIAL